ncbi:MAG TPA: helix-hairpin-helix domain-containing protein [Candidatus Saccharimonadales bacterium]|nr:helix-hairpin-helix domain-containing protein [Candidatus Saccharimonadales bacterium]
MVLGDRIAIGALASAVLALALGAWLVLAPATGDSGSGAVLDPLAALPSRSGAPHSGGTLVVDVEGGVARPGIAQLPEGSRVADAIAAAGGYSPRADLNAAAAQINLASALHDGQQVLVPLQGSGGSGGGGGGGGSGGGGGLVDLNSASADALDALPGIGPVTVQKIIAARTDQPFATLDELVQRKVMSSSQLDGIRDLVTLG